MLRTNILILLIIALSGCNQGIKKQNFTFLALNTTCTITLFDAPEVNIKKVKDIVLGIENLMSSHIEHSDIYKINSMSGNSYHPDERTLNVIKKGLFYSKISEGVFDIAIGPLVSLWNIGERNIVPEKTDIEEILPLLDYHNVTILDNGDVRLEKKGMALDLGAIAKGYAADVVKEYLISLGVKSAIINLGGNINLIGSKVDGSNWKIGIQHPRGDRGEYIGIVELSNSSFVSSGDYERFFIKEGIRYHHILSRDTGYPLSRNFIGTSIISETSIDGDALSTITFGSSMEQVMSLNNQFKFLGIFITDEYTIYISEELKAIFTLKDDRYRLIVY